MQTTFPVDRVFFNRDELERATGFHLLDSEWKGICERAALQWLVVSKEAQPSKLGAKRTCFVFEVPKAKRRRLRNQEEYAEGTGIGEAIDPRDFSHVFGDAIDEWSFWQRISPAKVVAIDLWG